MRTTAFSSSLFNKFLTAIAILALMLAALPVTPASAATITVNVTNDENVNNGSCSLREAIIAANNNAAYNGCNYSGTGPDDVITLTSGATYTLSLVGASATTGDLDVGNAGGTSGNLIIQASGAANAIIDANDINRVFEVGAPGDPSLTLIHITVTDGTGPDGAGIYFAGAGTLTLDHSTVSGNVVTGTEACGAGIFNNSTASISIMNSTVDGNSCTGDGTDGAGLYKGMGGTLTISDSTFSNNSTVDNGGGIRLDMLDGTATILNSTFAGNTAGSKGGGIQVKSGTVAIGFSTFSGNAANSITSSTGGGVQADGGSVSVIQSILANSTTNGAPGADCDKITPGVVTLTNSLVENKNDCTGTVPITSDPALEPLEDNGGPTQTMALRSGSPAIDAGNPVSCPDADQRGVKRPQGNDCDLGAYELEGILVAIGNFDDGPHFLGADGSLRKNYTGVNSGPVRVITTLTPILASQRVLYGGVSYSEMMGLPIEQLSKEYWFPWYNNSAMNSQLRVSNIGTQSTTIKVYLAGDEIDSFTLAQGEAARKNYPNANNGPMRVTSSNTNILATLRVLYGSRSYSELMGMPVEGLSHVYYYPAYNNVGANSQLRVTNVGDGPTTITVYLEGDIIDTYELAAGAAERRRYPGENRGPLQVVSDNEQILTTIRLLKDSSYAELAGVPGWQLSQEAWYPVYDNVNVGSQLRVANVGDGPTTITVYLAGQQIDSFALAEDTEARRSYPGENRGPLQVVSSAKSIVSSVRLQYKTASFSSLNEVMGLPGSLLSTRYYFPWYNNTAMSSELRLAMP